MNLYRNTLEYRLLVELSGQGHDMTVHDLWYAVSGPDGSWIPLDIEDVLRKLWCDNLVTAYWDPVAVTWQGVEALRRVDTESTRPMRAVRPRRRWWRWGR